jgi:hypothetical protein
MKHALLFLSMLCCAIISRAETPAEAAAEIHRLIQAKQYEMLFTQRYSEWHKIESSGESQEDAIKKLSAMFEKQIVMMLQVYQQLSQAEFSLGKSPHPQKSETGDTATATINLGHKEIPFTLHLMKSGVWGFHL